MFDLFFNLCRVEILEFKKNKIKYILYYLLLTLATVFTPRGIMKNLEIIILQQVYQELALPRVIIFIPVVSLYTHCKTKIKKNKKFLSDFIEKMCGFLKFLKIEFC